MCVHTAMVLCGGRRTSLCSWCSSSMFVGFWGSVPWAWTLVHRPVGGRVEAKEYTGLSACYLLALCLFCDRTWAAWNRHSHLFSLMSGEATLNHSLFYWIILYLFSFFLNQWFAVVKNTDYEAEKALKNPKYKDRAGKRREQVGSEGTFQRDDAPASVHSWVLTVFLLSFFTQWFFSLGKMPLLINMKDVTTLT